jgi:predicted permease
LWPLPVFSILNIIIGGLLGAAVVPICKPPPNLKVFAHLFLNLTLKKRLFICTAAVANINSIPFQVSASAVYTLTVQLMDVVCESGGPFSHIPNAKNIGATYISIYVATNSLCMWTFLFNFLMAGKQKTQEEKEVESTVVQTVVELDEQASEEQPTIPEPPKTWTLRIKEQYQKTYALLSRVLNPIAIAVIISMFIGLIPPLKSLFFGDQAPLQFITGVGTSLSGSSVAGIILLLGASLNPKSASLKKPSMVIGIAIIRLLCMPLIGLSMVTAITRMGILAGLTFVAMTTDSTR